MGKNDAADRTATSIGERDDAGSQTATSIGDEGGQTATSFGETGDGAASSRTGALELLPEGKELGSYTITRLIGRGGMGAVYEATHRELGKRAAIKTLLPEHAIKPDVRTRFLREGQASSKISHPHVVDVYDVGEQEDIPYLIMEYLDGEDLASLLDREGALSPERSADIMVPVLAALAAAHDMGIVHRDLKPDNIFVCEGRGGAIKPKVVDFGISKIIDDSDTHGLTGTSTLMGTPYYMSPEQAKSAKNIDARSDQFSMAAILYQCLVGNRPFDGDTLYTILDCIVRGTFPPPREANPDIPEELEAAILKAMSVKPAGRFNSVRGLARVLLPYSSDKTRVMHQEELAADGEEEPDSSPEDDEPAEAPKLTKKEAGTVSSAAAAVTASQEAEKKGMSPTTMAVGALAVVAVGAGIYFATQSDESPGPATSQPAATAAPEPEPPA
ncbi:MAG: serine/threonine protein kinase, partial [Deltaproteobacteria bacterium]|nr:serine/threonine protein kinase [Deltaproteobacteria bacterium]MBW2530029.1 serine/threonine protein kinase [Deltaproteobacteria bacterium]